MSKPHQKGGCSVELLKRLKSSLSKEGSDTYQKLAYLEMTAEMSTGQFITALPDIL